MSSKTKISSYSEELKELRNNLGKILPEDALAIFDSDAEFLQKNYQSILKLKSGDKAPNFSLSNHLGETVSLTNLLSKGKIILVFYRGTWCPYCNLQLQNYQKELEKINSLGANLVAISPQNPDETLSIKEKNDLKFEVLSDNGNIVAKQFTTVFESAEIAISTMKELGIDFDAYYSDDSRELPIPAIFIIEKDATISFAKTTGGDYRNRVEVSEIINALNK